MQILQFIVGSAYAAIHLFVSYTVPVATPYEHIISQPLSSASSLIASATSTEALPIATGAAIAFLKKLVYRAAGEEGLAENIPGTENPAYYHQGQPHQAQQALQDVKETVFRTEYQAIPCIDTSGQAFAIYLNLIYLAPLTGLFVRFFVKSYIRRTSASTKHTTKKNVISKAQHDAAHGVSRELESLGRAAEDGVASGVKAVKGGAKAIKENAKAVKDNVRGRPIDANGKRDGSLSPENKKFVDSLMRKVSKGLEDIGEGEEASRERARKLAKELGSSTSSPRGPRSERGASPDPRNGQAANGVKAEAPSDKSFADAVKEEKEEKLEVPNGNEAGPPGAPGDKSFADMVKENKDDEKDSEGVNGKA